MTTYKKPLLGLTPRDFWLHDRVRDCIEALHRQDYNDEYDSYRKQVRELAKELLYTVQEWDKYDDENKE